VQTLKDELSETRSAMQQQLAQNTQVRQRLSQAEMARAQADAKIAREAESREAMQSELLLLQQAVEESKQRCRNAEQQLAEERKRAELLQVREMETGPVLSRLCPSPFIFQ
jgi:chromosome segregation ATPase